MTDTFSSEQRSVIMGKIKGKDTEPELLVRKFMHGKSFRFRLHDRKLPCHPDIVLKKYKTVIFVNGCFWHGHENCKYFRLPKSNVEYWKNKITTNRDRDKKCIQQLEQLGWTVYVIWTCELKGNRKQETLNRLVKTLSSRM